MFKWLKTLLLPVAILAATLGVAPNAAARLAETRIGGYHLGDASLRPTASTQVPESQQGTTFAWRDTVPEFSVAAKSTPTIDRVRSVAQQGFDYAVENPRVQGLNRMQLGKDAEVQATRWMRRWAERNDIPLGEGGLQFQVRGANSVPDVVFDPAKQILDFKLTPKAVRPAQSANFANDFPGYGIDYIFGP